MATAPNTLLIEGTFTELADELAQYIDAIRKVEKGVNAEITPALDALREMEQTEEPSAAQSQQILAKRDEVLKKIVVAAPALNAAPEKEITAAYNLLIHLIRQSSSVNMFLPRICGYLAKPLTSSPQHGSSLAISILSTIFNTLAPQDTGRYHVFLAILAVIRQSPSLFAFSALKSQLKTQLPTWLESWDLDEEDLQRLHIAISDAAKDAGDQELAHSHLVSALRAIPPSEASSTEAHDLALRALLSALTSPSVFDFTPLTASDAIQSLRTSEPHLFELLEIFAADTLDAYEDSIKTTPLSTIHNLSTSAEILQTKMRLLTLASLAASTPSRSLPYDSIVNALRIPREDVEKWVIDTIRAGLVEGKLSQLKGEFLVHRATYRVFGEKQWAEVQGRLMVWRRSLENVLDVVRTEKEKFVREEMAAASAAAAAAESGAQRGGERRRGGGGHHQRQHQQEQPREVELVGGGD
ncbi:eukaryotic translation initiation factor 3 subunit M [Blastomyces dermatitidis ER-3]|uniref:Eukaryotic translation initiation factor 3 subunit M n=1 Tax=Ajellomyces dermatitidis (strain ER-3 / ATCC MYA-2586) TaxID=559297 RepID=A0ABP2F4H7_AJEDR|nr:eukaryotic translation initiation factor 3 subunit M [Blastomyces dermatitidis ER-3]EEQ91847.1 eukaryotic translation initiation factor 3 subunit M [Blastomyces dermatitidis ER-3]